MIPYSLLAYLVYVAFKIQGFFGAQIPIENLRTLKLLTVRYT